MASKNLISTIFEVIDKATAPMQKIGRSFGGLSEQMKTMSNSVAASTAKLSDFGKNMSDTGKSMSLGVTAPLIALGGFALKTAGDMESLSVAFETMLGGSAERASKMVANLNKFAADTPFELNEIAQAARSLLAAGTGEDQITEKLKMLGDIASTAQVPLGELVYVYDKMKNKGRATLEELMPLAEKGIPIYDALAKKTGFTKDAVMDMASKGKISFQMVEEELKKMTDKGGTYFEGMIKQSKTFNGVMSTFMDSIKMSAAGLGDFLINTLDLKSIIADLAKTVSDLSAKFMAWAKENPKLAKAITLLVIGVGLLGPALVILGTAISFVSVAVNTLLSPVFLVIAAIALVAGAAYLIYKNWKPIKQFFKSLWDGIIIIAKQVGQNLYNIFIQPFVDLWTKITEITAYIKTAIKGFADYIPDWLKGKLGITSSIKSEPVKIDKSALKASVENKNKLDANITLNLPDGVTAKTDKFKTDGGSKPKLNMNYNTGMVYAR